MRNLDLEEGSVKFAQELFNNKPFVEIDHTAPYALEKQDVVFSLNTVGNRFLEMLKLLQEALLNES